MALLDTKGLFRRCPECDRAVADDAERCPACGESLEYATRQPGGGDPSAAGIADGPARAGTPIFGSAGGAIFTSLGLGAGTGKLTGAAHDLVEQFTHALGEVAVRMLGYKMGEQALDDNPWRAPRDASPAHLLRRRIYRMLFPFRTGIREPQLIGLYRDLAKYSDAGVGFHDALSRIRETAKSPVIRRILSEIQEDLIRGDTLAEAFGRHAYAFEPLHLALIEVGESLGTVGDNMRLLVEMIEERRALRDSLARKFVQPVMLVFLANYVITLPIFFFGGIFSYIGTVALPTFVILAGVLFVLLGFPVLVSLLGRELTDRLRLDLPGVGTVVRANALGRFSRALGAAIGAGVEIEKSLRISAKATDNVVVQRAIESALPLIKERGLAQGLKSAGVLPPEVAAALAHGEATGTIADTLFQISAEARQRAARGTAILGSILAFTLIVFSALYAVFSVFTKMFAIATEVRHDLIRNL